MAKRKTIGNDTPLEKIWREWLLEESSTLGEKSEGPRNNLRVIFEAAMTEALGGDLKAIELLLNRAYGKVEGPAQTGSDTRSLGEIIEGLGKG